MDEMDMESMDILTGSNPTIQPDCNMLGKGVIPGLRYRHLGKSGLKVKVTNVSSLSSCHYFDDFWAAGLQHWPGEFEGLHQ